VRAMLASTIQHSNNKDQPAPNRQASTHQRVLMSQNPNSVLEAPPARTGHTFHTQLATRARAVLANRPPPGGSFVDDSTIRTPPRPTGHSPAARVRAP
jgi:hypothetical protein